MFFIDVQIFLQSFHRGCKRHAAAVREFPMTALRHDCPCRFAAAVYEGVRTALAVIQVFVRLVAALVALVALVALASITFTLVAIIDDAAVVG